MGGRMRRLAVIVALLLAMSLSGCMPAPNQAAKPEVPALTPLTSMPNLIGMSVDQGFKALGQTDMPVLVEFPGYEAHWLEESKWVAGTMIPAHDETVSVGMRLLSSEEVDGSQHKIESQTPEPGASLSEVTTITLLAGPHPNPTRKEWLVEGHAVTLKGNGADPCFDCHEESYCSDCHVAEAR